MILSGLKNKIFKEELDEAIDVAFFLGDILFYNQLKFFDVNYIEEYLIDNICLSKCFSSRANSFFKSDADKSLFVITESYAAGGHTRLMENLSLMINDNKDVLITRVSDKNSVQRLEGFFNNTYHCTRLDKEKSTSYIYRIVDRLVNYNKIILNIHPEDIFTVIACGVAKRINSNIKIFFVNHTDHTFTYGASIADIWFGISVYGIGLDKFRGIKGRHSFLGIVINKPDKDFFKKLTYPKVDKISSFVTAASAHKFKPYKNESIMGLLTKILDIDKGKTVNVVGVDLIKNPWWWRTKILHYKRLRFQKSLPYNDYLKLTQKADCYIDSHPAPGGTAFVEQFLQGIPCIGLKSRFSGYTPLEKIKKKSTDEVLYMLSNPPCAKDIKKLQESVFEVHAFSQVKKRFNECVNNNIEFENPMLKCFSLSEPFFMTGEKMILSIGFLKYFFGKDKYFLITSLRNAGFINNLNNLVKRAAYRIYTLAKNRKI